MRSRKFLLSISFTGLVSLAAFAAGCADSAQRSPAAAGEEQCECPDGQTPGTLCDCLKVETETGMDPCLGQCLPGVSVCDETTEKCVAVDGACDDGNACTDDGLGADGKCANTAKAEGATCDDGNACTTGEVCSAKVCGGGATVTCDDGNNCTTDKCDQISGCQFASEGGKACDDGNVCTTGEVCTGGVCGGGATLTCNDNSACTTDKCSQEAGGCVFIPVDCNDGKVCTDDACVPATGCSYGNNSLGCDDGNVCTTNDMCSGGSCKGGSAKSCNDSNACTTDSCVANACKFDPIWGGACDDGDAATSGDACVAGVCQGNLVCADDGNACTLDIVVLGVCTHPTKKCDDGNVCTTDSCVPATGCSYGNNAAGCDDGNVCTTNDMCSNGACTGGAAKSCDDGKVCTTDTCVPASGCSYASNAAGCDDGNVCTTNDVCSGGACAPGQAKSCDDENLCTNDSCNPQAGGCANAVIPGCLKTGEICGDGVDNDADGLTDCQDVADCGASAVGYVARFYASSGGTIWINYSSIPSPIAMAMPADEKGEDGVLGTSDDLKHPLKVTWSCGEVPTSVFVDSNGGGQLSAYVNAFGGSGPPPTYWKFDVWANPPQGPQTVPPAGVASFQNQATFTSQSGVEFAIYWTPQ